MSRQRPWFWVFLLGGIFTIIVLAVPSVRYAYRSPEGHLTLQAVEASIAFLAAYLLFGRFRDDGQVRHLLLVYALGIFAVNKLSSVLAVHVVSHKELVWGSLLSQVLGGVFLMAASIVNRESTFAHRPRGYVVAAMCLAVVSLVITLSVLLGPLPQPLDVDVTLIPSGRPFITGHPVLLAGQLLLVVLNATAAIAFTKESHRKPDELLGRLGAGCILYSFARLNYVLFPSLYSDFIYSGDILRLGFYLFVLAGASAEIRGYWRRLETANLELKALALRDALTGLNNRLGFTNHAEQELRLARRAGFPLTLMFIDLDDMKEINDRFGHDQGDAALGEMAEIMRESFRDSDILARLGGDEFVALMVATKQECLLAQERMLSNLQSRNAKQERPWHLSVSTGVSVFEPEVHATLQSLLDDADRLMYEQKHERGVKPRISSLSSLRR